jgi:Family of unknown function (DUF6169)
MKQENKYDFQFLGGYKNTYIFVTDSGLIYEIKFKPSTYIFGNKPPVDEFAYEFVIDVAENLTGKKPSLDKKIPPTIADIFYNFFTLKETVVVYVCDNSDGKATIRNRKFSQWFEQYNRLSFLKFDFLLGTEEEYYLTSMITRIDNPKLSEVLVSFQKISTENRK